MKKYSLLILLTLIYGYSIAQDELAVQNEICACLTAQEEAFKTGTDELKLEIFDHCYHQKINALATLKYEQLDSLDQSGSLDVLFNLAMKMTISLERHCVFVKENKAEFLRMILEEKSIRKASNKREGTRPPKRKKPVFQGTIIEIIELDESNYDLIIETKEGKQQTFFYKAIPKSYLHQQVELEYVERIIDGETIYWIKKMKLIE